MADLVAVEDALAKIQAKLDALSGMPPDVTEEFAQIRDAVKPSPKREVVRDSGSGEFVEKKAAKKRPKSTTTEKVGGK